MVEIKPETIKLSQAIELNGVKVNELTMRAPTVGDELDARQLAGGDDAKFELHILASLLGGAPDDLRQVLKRDYGKLTKAYLRLSSEE